MQDLSWEKLGYSAGLSKGAMTDLKNARTDTKLSTICKVALALGISVSELFDFDFSLDDLE